MQFKTQIRQASKHGRKEGRKPGARRQQEKQKLVNLRMRGGRCNACITDDACYRYS
uniref:Uncharacterized protein n=1 Tax=Oryza sativa subsp. japonica TaxID=39947 RepID=Q651A4_ORYSJ|nr:hypothetical protein [Oryza sativa Japonica Group]